MMKNNAIEQDHSSTAPAPVPLQVSASSAAAYALSPSNPRKKRTKMNSSPAGAAGVVKLKKQVKKPDSSAPKITRPCPECGKKFWSWKALFGHMRCHPERQWRGMNPPPNFRNRPPPSPEQAIQSVSVSRCVTMKEDGDRDVAACLLMLANSPFTTAASICHPGGGHAGSILASPSFGAGAVSVEILKVNNESDHNCRFECSSCRKVFSTHQALGGHRASHRNVKGCFANDYNSGDDIYVELMRDHDNHKCSICSRVFPSGQALGGHMRRHWEKAATTGGHQLLPLSTSSAVVAPTVPPPSTSSSSYQQAAAGRGGGLESSSCLCQDCHGFLSRPSYYTCSLSSSLGLDLDLDLELRLGPLNPPP